MWLLVGLGNPGSEYARNRHNIGFMVLDELARRASCDGFRVKFGAEFGQGQFSGERVVLLKPMEYMNVSGRAVTRAQQFFQVDPQNLAVVHDDIDLELGRMKVKVGGGHAGHNGVRSIISELGSPDFLRVRCGVGRPNGKTGVANFVLADFRRDEDENLRILIQTAADAVECAVKSGALSAMNRFNRKPETSQ